MPGLFRRLRYVRRRAGLQELSPENISDFIEIVSGDYIPNRLTLFAIFRDEIYFCRAFFDHYRALGVEQFLILDDGSRDGTREFLRDQLDCVLLTSTLSYGQNIDYRPPIGEPGVQRAGIAFKTLIPDLFFKTGFALYADADEFLILPPNVDTLHDVVERLEETGAGAVVAPLVEFFPRYLPAPQENPAPPKRFADLLEESPLFEREPLIELDLDGTFKMAGRAKSKMLFDHFGIKRNWRLSAPSRVPASPRFKTPVLCHGPGVHRIGSHSVSVAVSTDIMLPMAHFVFTPNFFGKVERANVWKSHAGGGAKYYYYRLLIDEIRKADSELRGPQSKELQSAQDLNEAGLMKWNS